MHGAGIIVLMANIEEWLTVQEAAGISGYHEVHIRRLLGSGKINARKFSVVWQVNRESLLAYLDQMEAKGEKRGPKKIDN